LTVITDYLLRDVNAYDWNLVTPVYTVRMISCADIQFTLHQIDTPIRFCLRNLSGNYFCFHFCIQY